MTLSGLAYRCSANDTFDRVALAVYGSEKYAPHIMAANPALCGRLIFDGGEEALLPVIETSDNDERVFANTLAPWRS